MNLAHSATDRRELVVDVLLGTLAGLLLSLLGIRDITSLQSPSNWVLIGAAAGLMLGILRQSMLLMILDIALALLVLIVAYSSMMPTLAPRWVRNDPLPPKLDAVFVLSENVNSDSTLSPNAFDRLRAGVAIARRDTTTWIVTSRIAQVYDHVFVSTDAEQRDVIVEAGIENRWHVVNDVHSTHDEALRAAALLLPARPNIAVVTSPMHTRRACATFERLGFHVTCRAARQHTHVTWHPLTSRDCLAAFRDYVYELLGMMKYRAEGWVS